ncbi:PPC domain-containing protein [Colwellia sp. MEBiC06753]
MIVEIAGVTPLILVSEEFTGLGTNARWTTYEFDVPATSVSFKASISGGSGNADLYVQYGKKPNTQKYDCALKLNGNEESCEFTNPMPGKWYIRIRGERHYNDVTLNMEALYPEPLY